MLPGRGAEGAHLAQKLLKSHYNPVGREEVLRVRVSERVLSVNPGYSRFVKNCQHPRVYRGWMTTLHFVGA